MTNNANFLPEKKNGIWREGLLLHHTANFLDIQHSNKDSPKKGRSLQR